MKRILLLMIIITYIGVSLASAFRESLIYDENVHVQVGMDAWKTQTFTKDPYSPPLIAELAVIPKLLNLDQLIPNQIPSMKLLPSRIVIILLSVCLMIAIYSTVKRTIGEPEALASVFLFAWEPSILAHNHYVTKDMGFTLFFFLSWIFFLFLCKKFSWKVFFGFSLLFGCMLAAKTSGVPFFFFSVLALVLMDTSYKEKVVRLWCKWLLACCIGLSVVWASYLFQTDVIIAKRDDPNRISSKLITYAQQANNTMLLNVLKFGTDMRIPLGTYLASQKNGLLLQKDQGSVFFLGYEYTGVRWYMLLVNLFLKLPIPLILLFGVSLFWLLKRQLHVQKFAPFIAPIVGITVFLCLSHVRPYVRYILPVYPFLLIISAVGVTRMMKKNWLVIPAVLCVWYTLGTLLYFPHFISFANAFAGPRDKRYEKLIDSDIDWGQGLFDVASFMKKQQVSTLSFSYFGTDNGNYYGLPSEIPYATFKKEEICTFHKIKGTSPNGKAMTAISFSNWYYCGYYKKEAFTKEKILDVVGGAILIFPSEGLQ
ncbi:glycosyltransferase family 39 protein [Patescibacteria group bacterium]|nr:glycosyltransferase family 39 protein [Patescibacteria group bacterium]